MAQPRSTTADPLGGVFFDEPEAASLVEAVRRFESIEAQIRPRELQHWAEQFSEAHFLEQMRDVLRMPVVAQTSRSRELPVP